MAMCHDFMKEQMVLNCTRKLSCDWDPMNVLFGSSNKHPCYMPAKVLSIRMLLPSLHCMNHSSSCELISLDQNSAGSGVDILASRQQIYKTP